MKNNEMINNTSIDEMTLIDDMPFEARVKNALIRNRITVLFQLLQMTYSDLLKIRNLGVGACDGVVDTLNELGYSLFPEEEVSARANNELRDSLKQELEDYRRLKKLLDEFKTLTSAKHDLDVMLGSVIEEFEEMKESYCERVRK